jgi:hypothetical protein
MPAHDDILVWINAAGDGGYDVILSGVIPLE